MSHASRLTFGGGKGDLGSQGQALFSSPNPTQLVRTARSSSESTIGGAGLAMRQQSAAGKVTPRQSWIKACCTLVCKHPLRLCRPCGLTLKPATPYKPEVVGSARTTLACGLSGQDNMAHAYTPGLKVMERTHVRKERRLPLPGQVHVARGQQVEAEQVVASTHMPGPVRMVNVAAELNVAPEEVPRFMLKQEGESVERGEVIAELRGLWGLFHSLCRAPMAGTIESISSVTGQVSLRGVPTPVELMAYLDGVVTEVLPREGVVIEATCTLVQGIFGLGGETCGFLRLAVDGPEAILDEEGLEDDCRGAVLIGGSLVTLGAVRKAVSLGAAAIVVGGMEDQDVDSLLGYPLGVAVTGHEHVGLTLVLTEGFGRIPMATRTFELLVARAGAKASVNGATQIRAGVLRPEVLVTQPGESPAEEGKAEGLLEPGRPVRLIRDPYFGQLATVVDLPPEPREIETEARVRVVRVRLADDREVTVPRANVELIEQ